MTFCPPAFEHVPEHVGTYGPEVADLADSAGMTLDPEQRLVIDAMYAHDARGRLVSTEAGCCAPRQNVKTHVAKAAALADLVLFDESMCLWTAHLRSTSDAAYAELVEMFDSYDHLRRLVDSMPNSDGEQAIRLRRPAVGAPYPYLGFMARSERGGRGLTGRRVTYDEALFLKPSMTSAMVPILSAQSMTGMVQLRYMGSAGIASSEVWRGVRDRGRAGGARSLAWLEWAAVRVPCDRDECTHEGGSAGCALDRRDLVAAANLALGRRIDVEFVMGTERQAMTPADFARERLGWWDEPAGGSGAFNEAAWGRLADAGAARGQTVAFGLATAPDRSWAAIAVAWRRPDEHVHVVLADYRAGTAWVRPRLEELGGRWGGTVLVDVASRGTLPDEVPLTQAEQAEAQSDLYDRVLAGTVHHGNELAMNVAVRAARWRPVGDTQMLDRKGSTDISPLAAAANAVRGVSSAPPSVYEERPMLVLG